MSFAHEPLVPPELDEESLEEAVLSCLDEFHGREVPQWDVIRDVSVPLSGVGGFKSWEVRKIVLRICRRLITKKIIVRNWKKRMLRISAVYEKSIRDLV